MSKCFIFVASNILTCEFLVLANKRAAGARRGRKVNMYAHIGRHVYLPSARSIEVCISYLQRIAVVNPSDWRQLQAAYVRVYQQAETRVSSRKLLVPSAHRVAQRLDHMYDRFAPQRAAVAWRREELRRVQLAKANEHSARREEFRLERERRHAFKEREHEERRQIRLGILRATREPSQYVKVVQLLLVYECCLHSSRLMCSRVF